MSRFSFNCSNGCGECDVRIKEFESRRTETLSGALIERQVEPQIVSTCCGWPVDVWDEEAQDVTHAVVAEPTGEPT